MTVRDVTQADDYREEEALSRRLMAGKIAEFTLEKRFLRKDGEICWATMTGTLVRRDSGAPLYTLSIVQVIGERKRAEGSLARKRGALPAIRREFGGRVLDRGRADAAIGIRESRR